MIEAVFSYETPAITRATRRHNPEDDIPHEFRVVLKAIVCSYLLGSPTNRI
jgi:hypothetical protein